VAPYRHRRCSTPDLRLPAWPGITLAAFLVNAPISSSVPAAGGIAIGNTLAPLLAALLLHRVGFRCELDRLRDALALVFLGALVGMLVSATIGTAGLVVSGALQAASAGQTWWVWWTGGRDGVLVFAPLFLSVRVRRPVVISWGRSAEAVLLFGGLFVVARLVLWSQLPSSIWCSPSWCGSCCAFASVGQHSPYWSRPRRRCGRRWKGSVPSSGRPCSTRCLFCRSTTAR
jgi:integral membrane sensor domain MASE1